MEVAIPLVSFLLLGEPFFDLKLGRGMAISPSLKKEPKNEKKGVGHLTIPYGRLTRTQVAISLFLSSQRKGGGHLPTP